ncbi:MAG: hypothetical protein Ta2G_01220 [Termitinemataceae bacterium]|nr:MAG: hypothetical protein Ta2G_01220 [Termitinemataceae bacterium]
MVVQTALFAGILALLLGVLLAIFRKVFHVETDVLVAVIRETLPGANCGACGFPGCDGFAVAVAAAFPPKERKMPRQSPANAPSLMQPLHKNVHP